MVILVEVNAQELRLGTYPQHKKIADILRSVLSESSVRHSSVFPSYASPWTIWSLRWPKAIVVSVTLPKLLKVCIHFASQEDCVFHRGSGGCSVGAVGRWFSEYSATDIWELAFHNVEFQKSEDCQVRTFDRGQIWLKVCYVYLFIKV